MRLSPLSLSPLLLLALVACAPTIAPIDGAPSTSTPTMIRDGKTATVTLELSASEDAQATVHTKARLNVTGVVTTIVNLGEVAGPLQVVKESAYGLYKKPNGAPILVLSAWWAGGGDEFVVTRTQDGLLIQKRSGDESGTCTTLETVGEVALPAGTEVTLEGLGEDRVDQSSLTFCAEKDVVGADGVED